MARSINPARREDVLAAVASVMREDGVFSARLQDIGKRLGITYTTLYHYFSDRNQLVEEVLLWTINKRLSCFENTEGNSALERLLNFARKDIEVGWEHQVALPFLGVLPEQNRSRIEASREKLLNALVYLVEKGINEGSIRRCHALTVCQVILNCLERFVSFDDWLATASKSKSRQTVMKEVSSILQHGILRTGVSLPRITFTIPAGERLVSAPEGVSEDYDRYEKIMRAATAAFNREGRSASIPRMAKQLGLSKSVVYHYALDKRDLLNQCYLRGIGVLESSQKIALLTGSNPVDEILIHRNNLFAFHGSSAGPFATLNALSFLHPPHLRALLARSAATRSLSEDRLKRAIENKQVRDDLDIEVAQAMFGQVLYGMPSWHLKTFPLSVMEVAAESSTLLLEGLQAKPSISLS